MGLAQFAKIAPYLGNPLVLAGFCLLLFFGILWTLVKARLLTKLSKEQSSTTLHLFLKYGFVVAIVTITLGLAYGMLRVQSAHREQIQRGVISQQASECSSNIIGDNNRADVTCVDKGVGAKSK